MADGYAEVGPAMNELSVKHPLECVLRIYTGCPPQREQLSMSKLRKPDRLVVQLKWLVRYETAGIQRLTLHERKSRTSTRHSFGKLRTLQLTSGLETAPAIDWEPVTHPQAPTLVVYGFGY